MLIDLSRKPLIVYPETCPSSVVVRSIGNHEVSGTVTYWVDSARAGRKRKELKPDASIARGKSMLCETRIPLPGTKRPYDEDPYAKENYGHRVFKPSHEPKVNILPEPFEVASVYVDVVTGAAGTWRAGFRIEFVDKMKKSPWVISISDVTTGTMLSTVAVSSLEPNPVLTDPLPLTKAVQHTVSPGNAWTRILDDDT